MSKSLNKLLLEIEHYIDDPREGLTEEIFYFISNSYNDYKINYLKLFII